MRTKLVAVLCIMVWSIAGSARANNTTSATAYSIMPNSTASDTLFNTTDQQRWYMFNAVAGRSYCVQTEGGVFFDTSNADLDTEVAVYRGDATTVITMNDDATEPSSVYLSRACFVAPFSEREYIKVFPFSAGESFYFRVALVETTLYSNWWFLGGDYNAWTLIRNTTNQTVSYTITWRNLAGSVLGSYAYTIAGGATAAWNPRSSPAVPGATGMSGSVEIAHNGSQDALYATTTTFSATTGVGFDTGFSRRH